MARKRATKLPTQGKRSGVAIAEDTDSSQVESIDNFFDQARSPEEKKDDVISTDVVVADTAVPSKRAARRPQRKAQEMMRLSLPGQLTAAGDAASTTSMSSSTTTTTSGQKQAPRIRDRKILGLPSPSELSKVSTMPPTPGTSLHEDVFVQEQIEVTRHAASLDDAMEKPVNMDDDPERAPESSDYPMHNDDDDDDDGDDLAPPVMDDDDLDEEPTPHDVKEPEENSDDQKPAAIPALLTNNLSDTESDGSDDDDNDKEGLGFNMVHDPQTPEKTIGGRSQQKAHGRKKKLSKQRDSMESDDKTPARKLKTKKKRRVLFSPKGIPIGNRDYDRIPIVEPSPDDEGGLRRSKRARTTPLEFWRNEKVEYGPLDDDELVEEIGDMPVPKAVIRALDTPYRKRKDPTKSKVLSKSKSKLKRRSSRDYDRDDNNDGDDEPFDISKLKRKYKKNLLQGETANVWDDGNDDLNDLSKFLWLGNTKIYSCSLDRLKFILLYFCPTEVVAYADQMEAAELPLIVKRTDEEGNVVGKAAQAFNVPSDENDNYVGYIMGNLLLPPRGIKDAESVGPCSQTFTVVTGQKKALEVAFADPDGPEGMLEADSAQRFLLGPGDLFRVPPGNTYRLQNHSRTKSCLLTWTIIRPRNLPSASDDE